MTIESLSITRQRGGNHHVLSSREFIIDRLSITGEDYGANIHRAYKIELDEMAVRNGRLKQKPDGRVMGKRYHKPSYSSFNKIMNMLSREGVIEFAGREEESDNPMFANMEWKPVRRYYRLGAGAGTLVSREDGHKPGLGIRDRHGRNMGGTNGREAAHAQNSRSRPIAKPGKPPTI